MAEIRISFNNKLHHINDVSHLVHNCVTKALNCESMAVTTLVMKFGALFETSNKLLQQFYSLLNSYGVELQKPPKAIESRWFALLRTAKVVQKLLQYLCEFSDGLLNASNKNAKVVKIVYLLGNQENRRIHFVKLTFIVGSLLPIEAIEKQLEVSSSVIHQLYSLIHVKLGAIIESM